MTGDVISMDDETHRCHTKKVCAYGNQCGTTPSMQHWTSPNGREGVTIHCGDCRAIMGTLPTDSIAGVVTDPPYHLCTMHNPSGTPKINNEPFKHWPGLYGSGMGWWRCCIPS